MDAGDLVCWEALDPRDPALGQARRLYETTLAADERIPWAWIEEAVAGRAGWRPGTWSPHLLLAAPSAGPGAAGPADGFAYGIHVPDYGGYACYLGVDPEARRRGAGTRLLRFLTRVLQVDAAAEGGPLPFVVWESRRPEEGAPPQTGELWRARLRLFERVGAGWVSGLTFLAPNFARRREAPVPLQLFLVPVDTPREAFDAETLREVAAGLMLHVYGRGEGDRLFDGTLRPEVRPALKPVSDLAL